MLKFDPTLTGPLSDVRVVDLSRLVAGNMLTAYLADFGADVIKVEQPGTGDDLRNWKEAGQPIYWKVYGRNKRSLELDFKRYFDPKISIQSFYNTDTLVYMDLPRGRYYNQPKDRSKQSTFVHRQK